MPFRKTSPLILFFDCYIVTSKMPVYDAYCTKFPPHDELIRSIRMSDSIYRHVTKLEVVKYTLLSYATVPWDEMFIRVVCEDEEDRVAFFEFARKHLPTAHIVNERCATAAEYVVALSALKRYGDPWIFFSPNNDHPMIGDPEAFRPLIELAEDIEPLYPSFMIAILFSHFTESQNTVSPDQHDWAWYGGNLTTIIGETKTAQIIETSRFCCDSIRLYRMSSLLKVFANAKQNGRCIRLEDTGFYLTQEFHELVILPRQELCRHFDGYGLFLETTPPLFIPDGFFESDIKIRFGFADRKPGYVNVNPYEDYSYRGGVADLRCLLSELPPLWRDRISSIEIDATMEQRYRERRNDAFRYTEITDPYSHSFTLTNYKRSAWKICGRAQPEFVDALCPASVLTIPAERSLVNHAPTGQAAVYFLLSGVLENDNELYRKGDFVAFQGECAFSLTAVGENAQVVQVSVPVQGTPSKRRQIWKGFHP